MRFEIRQHTIITFPPRMKSKRCRSLAFDRRNKDVQERGAPSIPVNRGGWYSSEEDARGRDREAMG